MNSLKSYGEPLKYIAGQNIICDISEKRPIRCGNSHSQVHDCTMYVTLCILLHTDDQEYRRVLISANTSS